MKEMIKNSRKLEALPIRQGFSERIDGQSQSTGSSMSEVRSQKSPRFDNAYRDASATFTSLAEVGSRKLKGSFPSKTQISGYALSGFKLLSALVLQNRIRKAHSTPDSSLLIGTDRQRKPVCHKLSALAKNITLSQCEALTFRLTRRTGILGFAGASS